jgi:hypothetical protein
MIQWVSEPIEETGQALGHHSPWDFSIQKGLQPEKKLGKELAPYNTTSVVHG